MPRIKTPPGLTEIVSLRKLKSKTFFVQNLPDGRQQLRTICSTAIAHTPSDWAAWRAADPANHQEAEAFAGPWDDVDETWIFEGGFWKIANAFYSIEVDPAVVGFRYISQNRGDIDVTLQFVDGAPAPAAPTPTVSGNVLTWTEFVPGMDLEIHAFAAKIEIYKHIKNDAARVPLTWLASRSADSDRLNIKQLVQGHDNVNRLPVGGRNLRRRRPLEIDTSINNLGVVDGRQTIQLTENATGFVFDRAPGGNAQRTNQIIYPIRIDADITDTILDDNQDGTFSRTPNIFHPNYASGGDMVIYPVDPLNIGMRFTVDGPASGDTIDSADLRVNTGSSFSGWSVDLVGNNVDNAAAWANNNRPDNMDATTASLALSVSNTPASTTDVTWAIDSIVAEIVARAGWLSGNTMRFGTINESGTNGAYIGDYATGGQAPAELDITYTVAGGTATITASQTETGDTTAAALAVINAVSASIAEAGDAVAAALAVIVLVSSSVVEAGDTASAAIQSVAQVTASQTEQGDTTSAALQSLIGVTASQTETGDTTSAALEGLVAVTASQAEVGDTAAASLQVIVTVSASTAETGDVTAAAISASGTRNITASQNESGDTTAAAINAIAQISAAQSETGDTTKARILPPDHKETFFTVAYAGLHADSPFAGDPTYSAIEIGDSCVYEINSTPDSHPVSMSGDGVFTLGNPPLTQQQQVDFYIWDSSDETLGTPGTLTIDPEPAINVTAAQTEVGDTTSAALVALIAVTANQAETGDTTTATLQVTVTVTASNAESGDVTAAAISASENRTITASQTESGDTTGAALKVLVAVTSNQAETGDALAASLQVIASVTASQPEQGDTQAASIDASPDSFIVASQLEIGDSQIAALSAIAAISASQIEVGDIGSAALTAFISIAASQSEIGDQSAAIFFTGGYSPAAGRRVVATNLNRTMIASSINRLVSSETQSSSRIIDTEVP